MNYQPSFQDIAYLGHFEFLTPKLEAILEFSSNGVESNARILKNT
jgi:hypothetical protein